MKYRTISLVLMLIAAAASAAAELTVFAAASISDAMRALAAAYSDKGGGAVCFNFASSGALARQIDAGAPVDLFAAANTKWMDWLEERNLIQHETRFDLAGNSLVLVAPVGSGLVFNGQVPDRLAVGDFNSVPAGLYAREALEYMGWLGPLRPKLVMGSSVRTVLMYVERGEVAAGIVYASDAKRSTKVETVGTFPAESHAPIVYPVAACSTNEEAIAFIDYLKTDEAGAILAQFGFTKPERPHD